MSHASREIGAIITLGEGGNSPQEQLVLEAQRACALDLIDLLREHGIGRIVVASPSLDWIPDSVEAIRDQDDPDRPFHFGARIADLIEQHQIEPALYFGGGSTPLFDGALCEMLIGLLMRSQQPMGTGIPSHICLTNNLHSSDWFAISRVDAALPILRQAERDNSVAWLLQESGEYNVRVLSGVRPATSLDIDTPTDLALLAAHPAVMPNLRKVVDDPRLAAIPVQDALKVMRTEGSTVLLIGRTAPLAWNALNKAARCWTRVIAEERGMVASGRIERGEVRSLLVPWVKARGFAGFFDDLASMADCVLFDDRVLMAASNVHASAADRFASDLYWIDEIRKGWLREFTEAARKVRIPVILGGHTIIAGGLYALTELIGTPATDD